MVPEVLMLPLSEKLTLVVDRYPCTFHLASFRTSLLTIVIDYSHVTHTAIFALEHHLRARSAA